MAGWSGGRDALGSAAASLFPSLYLGLPIGAMIAIRELHGREALFLLMVTVMVSDTAQYYSGRAFGRRLLAPSISPKKTIAGAVGGFVFGPSSWWSSAGGGCPRRRRRSARGSASRSSPSDRRRPVRVDVEAQRRGEGQLDADPRPRRCARSDRRLALRGARLLHRT
jgi:hypothetical protein